MRVGSNWSDFRYCLIALAMQFALMPGSQAQQNSSQEDPDGDIQWSIIAPLAPKSLLLDGAIVEDFIVVVGERGHVLTSENKGESWQQVRVPTRATLTSVFFSDRSNGWAVGHDAVIIKTSDGGETWARVHFAPEEERPLLDVWFENAEHGIATGAYGYFLETFDGGETWEDRFFEVVSADPEEADADPEQEITAADMMDFLDDEDPIGDLHLNDLRSAPEGTLFLAAEAGHVFRSDDVGETWREMASPYEGSFYGTLPLGDDRLLLYGLRGNLFYSTDGGEAWQKIDAGTDAILMGGALTGEGIPVIAGLGGTLLVAQTASAEPPEFALAQQEDRKALATMLPAGDGEMILLGEAGITTFKDNGTDMVNDRAEMEQP